MARVSPRMQRRGLGRSQGGAEVVGETAGPSAPFSLPGPRTTSRAANSPDASLDDDSDHDRERRSASGDDGLIGRRRTGGRDEVVPRASCCRRLARAADANQGARCGRRGCGLCVAARWAGHYHAGDSLARKGREGEWHAYRIVRVMAIVKAGRRRARPCIKGREDFHRRRKSLMIFSLPTAGLASTPAENE
jgi:hypothetical protein